jgi:hypothetical protein
MRAFSDLEEVEACLETLMHWEPRPLATRLPRQPGLKEPRYMHLLSGDAEPPAPRVPERAAPLEEQVEALRQEVRELREELATFRRQFEN